jgi:hypothetical protein
VLVQESDLYLEFVIKRNVWVRYVFCVGKVHIRHNSEVAQYPSSDRTKWYIPVGRINLLIFF